MSTANARYYYPSSEGWLLNTTCADYSNYQNYKAFDIVDSPDDCTSMCQREIEKDEFTTPPAERQEMCCGYKYFAGSNFQQCMLTKFADVIEDIETYNYH